MKLHHDFSALWRIAEAIGAPRRPFSLERGSHIDEIEARLQQGVEVRLEDLGAVSGLLAYEGRQVLLYIPDQGPHISAVLAGNREPGKKFHVAWCETLEKMKASGRFNRYIATTDVSGEFQLSGSVDQVREIQGRAGLYVCQLCLNLLNYRQCRVLRNARRLRETFDLTDFFSTYASCFTHLPRRGHVRDGESLYAPDWPQISQRLRAAAGWSCSECRADCSDHRQLLDVHHVDGDKRHNTPANLRVLCKACHRLQPMHEHIVLTREETRTINGLRRQAGFFGGDWDQLLRYGDPASHGLLGLASHHGWPPPEIELASRTGGPAVELAWPARRLAISLRGDTEAPPGWRVMDLADTARAYFDR